MAEPKTKDPSRSLALVVLAAGKGERLRSDLPKVLHPICGRPALWHALQAGLAAKPSKVVIVVGHGADQVRDAVRSWKVRPVPVFAEQAEQLGTGHAASAARRAVGAVDDVLIITGDFDPVRPEDLRKLVARHRRSGAVATVASTVLDDPGGYGRVVREGGRLVEVVEDVDADPAIRRIREVSLILMAVRRAELFRVLPRLDRNNRQREFYLNRILPVLLAEGRRVEVVGVDTGGAMGVNSRTGLAAVERIVRQRINARQLANGVTLVDPATTYIDVDVRIGRDTTILPMTFLEGATHIGRRCTIGPSTRIVDSTVGDDSTVTFAVLQGAAVGKGSDAGPFARLRPGAELADGVHVGSYVEIKGSRVGRGSKVPHLSYIGDAEIGSRVNIGAGTIVVNFDGYEKHRTVVEDDARIGSDTMLVAPVRVGKGAATGAGSVIADDVPPGALAVERAEQRTVRGYRARKDAEHRGPRRGAGRGGGEGEGSQ